MSAQQIQRLAELIRGIEAAMFITVDPDGSSTSRPMVVQDFDFDGDLWFFTRKDSAKINAVQADNHVCITFMDPASNRYISASGIAEVVADPGTMSRMWRPAHAKWFPDGPNAGNLALIRVCVTTAEYWDTPHSEIVETFHFAHGIYKSVSDRAHDVRTTSH